MRGSRDGAASGTPRAAGRRHILLAPCGGRGPSGQPPGVWWPRAWWRRSCASASDTADRRADGRVRRSVGLCVAVRRSRTRDVAVCALADVGLSGCLQGAPRRRERAGAAGAGRLSDRGRSRARPGRAADRAPAAHVLARRTMAARRPRARVGALVWFLVPARHARLHHAAPPRALRPRRRDDLRGVRHRRDGLLDSADGPALVCGGTQVAAAFQRASARLSSTNGGSHAPPRAGNPRQAPRTSRSGE